MNARVCFFEGKIRKSCTFYDADDFTNYLDKMFYGKYPIIRKPILFLLNDMVGGRDYAKYENDLYKIEYFIDKNEDKDLKFDFFIRIK